MAKATPLARTVHDSGGEKREVHYDAALDKTTVRNTRNDGSARIDDIDTTISYGKVKEFSIARNDPETAKSVISTTMHYRRAGWDARLETRIPHALQARSLSLRFRRRCLRGRRALLQPQLHP